MKKLVQKMMEVEEVVCNICGDVVDAEPFNKERISIVRALFDNSDFHAHEACINQVVRAAFEPYYPKK